MRARPTHAILVLATAALAAGCWSDVKEENQQGNDSATVQSPATGGGTTEGGVSQPGTPSGGPLPTPVDTGPGRAAQPGGTNAGARDTTAAARPPQP